MLNSIPILLALLAFVSWALADTISVILYRIHSASAVTINSAMGRILFWLLLLPFFWQDFGRITIVPLVFNLIAGLSSGIGSYLFGRSVKLANPAVVTPICSGWGASALVLSRVFFHEPISIYQSVSVMIILLGYLTTISTPGLFRQIQSKQTQGIIYAFLTFLIWGICGVTIKLPSVSYGWYWTSVILLVPYVVVVFFDAKENLSTNNFLRIKPLWILVAVVLFSALADIGYSGSFAMGGSNAIVGTIGGSYAALSTILMYIFYREPMTKQQKVGAIISITGIILTAFFSSI